MDFTPEKIIEDWHRDLGIKKPDIISNDLISILEYVLSKVANLAEERAMTAERLTQYFAEYDRDMRSLLAINAKEEPTTLVSVYFREFAKEIRKRGG